MGNYIDRTGRRYGRLTAVSKSHRDSQGLHWLCVCECSSKKIVLGASLSSGNTKSCGCLMLEVSSENGKRRLDNGQPARLTHGMARVGKKTSTYVAWRNARQRCNDPNSSRFKDWGGRGIRCLFPSVTDLIAEIGEKPDPALQLDRINNDGHYEPGNVRWATRSQQARNRRTMTP